MQQLVPSPCCNPCCPSTLLNLTTLIQDAVEDVECCSNLSVDTLIELKDFPAASRVAGMGMDMLGREAPFDGLGIRFNWDAASFLTPNDVTVVLPNDWNVSLGGRWRNFIG